MESILTSIKKLIGITEEQRDFDDDIIMHINSAFASLTTQLGVGPSKGFYIEDDDTTWDEYMDESSTLHWAKEFVYINVKLMFDPPASSAAVESLKQKLDKVEWLLSLSKSLENQNGGE